MRIASSFVAPGMALGRQPILDRERRVVAYELLFREAGENEAHIADPAAATAHVIGCAFGGGAMSAVLGPYQAFINVDAQSLMSDGIESLPRDHAVLELLETVTITDAVIRRCRALKAKGYRLALDDFAHYSEEYDPLLDLVDIVKIDVLLLDRVALMDLVRRIKQWPAKLLAEKVASLAQARQCQSLGFDFFQGFYFGRPVTLTARPGARRRRAWLH